MPQRQLTIDADQDVQSHGSFAGEAVIGVLAYVAVRATLRAGGCAAGVLLAASDARRQPTL
ncbi:hypothetical protein P3W85_39495 [Cupriavidus basilensis]|uniref:Uncharacterized protein n=1 Tax=Cupriavidus basilensis TaxID=68895 RepID=A0ABT6B270_9BURK|nr:hypothetical protein [Cupriavidus basilensis]MDF3838979.1 hypothetical protein [Cupriavidus basilensis]